ncbi:MULTISPECIES: hypothetical protein [unclassified Campylobacter]|uniref:tetratricopeptide repeat protein n=1 Tax=unclassified Campylobacter TaxID=2593542 RepID=UPI001BD92612|nr:MULTISPECIES: hypothetical protein [unclassified Campylobacter]MBT0880352.1 hypothetical protein [Campylobacter sp. 2018MI27]MBT0883864.1 hypothetical protein [Campylobacter sp. 2018MI10]MBZ8006794.1 hypothetical protein [Campylobacter sp. RM9334]
MKKLTVLFLSIFIFTGCQATLKSKQDILDDTLTKEKIYTAIKNYDDLIKINKEKLQKKDTPETRIALALNYYDINDFDSSLYYLKPLLQDGKNYKAFLLKAKIEDYKENYNEALNDAIKSINLNPKNPEAYNVIGIVKAKQNKYEDAKIAFLKAKSLFLADEIVNNNLGLLEISEGNYAIGVDYLLPLYNRNYKNLKIINNLVFALAKLNRDSEAIEIIKRENLAKEPKKLLINIKQINTNEKFSK